MVNKGTLQEKIAQLVNDKRIEGISDMRDESNQKGIRLVIELKKGVIPQVVLNNLYKHSSCSRPSARTCWHWSTVCRARCPWMRSSVIG